MENFLIIGIAALCTLTPLWLGQRYGLLPLVSPMHLLAYFCALGFFAKVVVYSQYPDFAFYARYIDTPGAPLKGALYLALFVVLMCLGYRCAIDRTDQPAAIDVVRMVAGGIVRQGWLFAAAFAFAGLTFALLLDARGLSLGSANLLSAFNQDKQINVQDNGVGATLAGLKTLFVVPKLAFVLLLAQGLIRCSVLLMGQAFLLAVLLVGVALISGDRFELVELLVMGAAVYVLVGAPIGVRAIGMIVGAAITVLLLSAYMTTLRGSDVGVLHQLVGSTYFLDVNAAVMVTDKVQPERYLLGESYGWWTFGWVPRAIWLDKPAIDLGVFLKRDVMGVTTGGAFNVTGPGEAFINFGWAGACVGFVLGWLYRRGEVWLLSPWPGLRHASFFYYPVVFYPFVQATLHSSFSGFVVGAVAQVALIVVAIALVVPRYLAERQDEPLSRRSAHV